MCIRRSFLRDIKDGEEGNWAGEDLEDPSVGTLDDLVREISNMVIAELLTAGVDNADDENEASDESKDEEIVFLDEEVDVEDFEYFSNNFDVP